MTDKISSDAKQAVSDARAESRGFIADHPYTTVFTMIVVGAVIGFVLRGMV